MYVGLNCLKHLCLSFVSGVPHFFFRTTPLWSAAVAAAVELTACVVLCGMRVPVAVWQVRLRTARSEYFYFTDITRYEYVGPPCSRATIYAARVSRGSCSYRSISAVCARPQQQTRRPPLLLSINGTDRRTDTRPLYDACHIQCGPRKSTYNILLEFYKFAIQTNYQRKF